MKRYNFHELRSLAQSRGLKKSGLMNKAQLCEELDIIRVEYLPKYSMEDIETGIITLWRSVFLISKTFEKNSGSVIYALKKNRPMKTKTGTFHIVKLNPVEVGN